MGPEWGLAPRQRLLVGFFLLQLSHFTGRGGDREDLAVPTDARVSEVAGRPRVWAQEGRGLRDEHNYFAVPFIST